MTKSLFGAVAAEAEVRAERMIVSAIEEHHPVAVFAMFSGGHDSLTATSLASQSPAFTAAVHINTLTGIKATTEFVRRTCEGHGWPLIELTPDSKQYEELVLTRGGFPSGPKSHNSMYYYLKQRQVHRLVREHKTARNDRVMLITGIRRAESQRRMNSAMAVPVLRKGAQLWVNPILDWTALDCGRYMEDHALSRNEVVDLLHRSGECLCGALAHRDEIHAIDMFFPEEAKIIHDLERRAQALNLPSQRWATKVSGKRQAQDKALALCSSCQLNFDDVLYDSKS